MNKATDWHDATRIVKSRVKTFATVVTWWTLFISLTLLSDSALVETMGSNDFIGAGVVIGILVAGFLIGDFITSIVFSGLPDPDKGKD